MVCRVLGSRTQLFMNAAGALAVTMLASGITGCSRSTPDRSLRSPGASAASPSASPNPTRTPTPTPTTTPSLSAKPPSPLVEGRNIGYIRALKPPTVPTQLVFDTAQYLDTQAKKQEAAAKGWAPSDCAEVDGCFIANASRATVTVRLAADAKVTLLPPGSTASYPASLEELAASFREPSNRQRVEAPFWLTMEGDEVVSIEQVYTP